MSYKIMQGQAGQRLIIQAKVQDIFGISRITSHYASVEEMLKQYEYEETKVISYKVNNNEEIVL